MVKLPSESFFRSIEVMRNRVYLSMIIFFICTVVLLGRLYDIQVLCGNEFRETAREQQVVPVLRRYSRGTIYDRNMEKLTETKGAYYYLVPREVCTAECKRLISLAGGEEAGSKGEEYLVYRTESFQPTINFLLKENYGIYGFYSASRYADNQVAAHLIGYLHTADGTGCCGLEKMYEERLSAEYPDSLLHGNGTGEIIPGKGVTPINGKPALVITIDKELQSSIEMYFQEEDITGAAVVMEQKSGQILAMISSPTFNPNRIQDYFDSDSGELVNKATQGQYPPGSVFKLIVAAAALEKDKALKDFSFDCRGSVTVHGITLPCEGKEKGHGPVKMKDAFAMSCNGYFAKLSEEIGSEVIMDMAVKMGLGSTVWDNYPDEAEGCIPSYEERHYSGLTNFSIGQGSLLSTPVQICQMTNIIASGGYLTRPVLVMSQKNEMAESKKILSDETADELKEMMRAVVKYGTASSAELPVSAAGKTGSAEASTDGKSVVHGWFTGFFPAENPIYTVTVIVENGKTGSQSALPVFVQITDYLY